VPLLAIASMGDRRSEDTLSDDELRIIGRVLPDTQAAHFAGYAPPGSPRPPHYRAVRERQRRRGFVVDVSASGL
jgi:hypothetical protein